MKNKPGLSYGPDHPVNILHYPYCVVLFDYVSNEPILIYPYCRAEDSFITLRDALRAAAAINYGDTQLDPVVRNDIDMTS